jgi:hypothetical protein
MRQPPCKANNSNDKVPRRRQRDTPHQPNPRNSMTADMRAQLAKTHVTHARRRPQPSTVWLPPVGYL